MSFLYAELTDTLLLDPESKEFEQSVQLLVSYFTGVCPALKFQTTIQGFVNFKPLPFSAKDFRLKLADNSYYSLHVKFYMLNLLLHPCTKENAVKFARQFKVPRDDAFHIFEAITPKFRTEIRKSDRIKSLTKNDVSLEAVALMKEKLSSFYKELMPHIKGRVHKKIRFIVKSENSEFADFYGELICKAVKVYYFRAPWKVTDAHLLNYLRSTVSNTVNNIIETYTTEKRGRLVNSGDDGFGGTTFTMTCVSENQLLTNDEGSVSYEDLAGGMEGSDSLLDTINFESLLRTYGTTNKRKRAIRIVGGMYDRRFTRYLRVNNYIRKDEDNCDFIHRNGFNTTCNRLSTHLRLDAGKLERFFVKVGKEISYE